MSSYIKKLDPPDSPSCEKWHFSPCFTLHLDVVPTFTKSKSISSTFANWEGSGGGRRRGEKNMAEFKKNDNTHPQSTIWKKKNKKSVMYLGHVGLLIDGHKDFVEKRFKVIALHTVHDKAFQRRHCTRKTVRTSWAHSANTVSLGNKNLFAMLLFFFKLHTKWLNWTVHSRSLRCHFVA